MKKLLLFIFSFISFSSFAQLDREHWFAPMVDRSNQTNPYQSVYMSTNEITPFKVDIYNNNIVIGSVTISKNNPVKYSIPNSVRGRIITNSQSDLFRPVPMGFYVKGDKPFFASLRFSIKNHGEIQTSKGTAALGTEFRAVMAPITVYNGILNFMNSVMATEDNTRVTITDFSPTVQFSDYISRSQITFTLNKGQSYIIDGTGDNSQNYTGYIGAKIISDKPIVIANGNFNGQYAGNYSNSSDILMDQGVPVDKLGQEFVLMKGNGNPTNNMEKGLILATENNTEIYINNGTTPVATLNAGQYYITDNSAYLNQGFAHYNMLIKATKNVYVYQLLAGANSSEGTEEATGGFNYIPPLNCYLPKKIDEIGKIEENEYSSNGVSYSLTVRTKLNIITERGASIDVKRNGVSLILNSTNGPFDVTGNNAWVTYSIPNITGNIAVFSSNAVTAGISAGNDAVGYGGYFAGFSSIPLITKTEGDCLPGVKLEVTEGFDSYLWLEKVGGVYVPAQGINNLNTYSPTQAGIYAVKVKQGSCEEIQTRDFKFYNCTTFTNYDYTTCTEQVITPIFALSSQGVNIPTIKIDTPPTKGNAVVNPDGTITYTANPNATGTDTFKFSFCGNGTIPDCETVQATINLNQIEKYDVVLNECTLTGIATYNLSLAAVTPDTTVTKVYYETLNGAQNQIATEVISNFTNLTTADSFVWVRMVNTYGCIAIAKIELKSKLAAEVKAELYTKNHCDEDVDGVLDGIYKVDVISITPIVLQTPANHVVKYYQDEAKAIANGTDNITGIFSFTANRSIWIRVEPKNGCPVIIKEILLTTGIKLAITSPINKDVCDTNIDTTENIDLDTYLASFTTNPYDSVKYFDDLTKAQNNLPSQNISAAQTITANKTFYYRFTKAGVCDALGILNISFKVATPSTTLPASVTICQGTTTPLNVGTGYSSVLWSTGSTATTINVGVGNYFVDLTNSSGCVYRQNVSVVESPKPNWNIAAFNGTYCDDNFDGITKVKFSSITPTIITNSTLFTVEYSLFANFSTLLPNDWTYAANTTVYVRAISTVCPTEIKTIDFKIGDQLTLIKNIAPINVCDNDLNNTESINLANYLNLFITNPYDSVKYFDDLTKAQNNLPGQNIPAAQTITGNKTFYYRFKKAGVCDALGTLNISIKVATPSTTLPATVTVCQGTTTPLNVGTGFSSVLWSTGSTATTINVGVGNYFVDLTNLSGCVYRQNVSVVESPKPIWNIAAFNGTNCDNDFDGIIKVKFSTITPTIITNSSLFTVEYSLFANFSTLLPNDWTYTANTTVYVRAISTVCPTEIKTIDFKIGDQLALIKTTNTASECDDDFDGIKTANLANYKSLFTTEIGVTATYFKTLADAQKNTGSIPSEVSITNSGTYYLRFQKTGVCDNIGTLKISIKVPKKSTVLVDKNICPEATTTLDAGPGFSKYLWSNGSTAQSINVPVGEYWVELTADGCTYRQQVSVKSVPLPVITGVEIQGGTVTVLVTGGNPPYQYSLNGSTYQNSNVFTNIPSGDYTVYVISADQCLPITTEINILRILNVITPNDDGKNDVLNYADLLRKDNPFLQIFDRYGVSVFKGDKNNRFSWDGKISGKAVATGSYWYVLQWQEPGSTIVAKLTGWVLVKSRE